MNDNLVIVVQHNCEMLFSIMFTMRTGSINALRHLMYVNDRYCTGLILRDRKMISDLQVYVMSISERIGAGAFCRDEQERVVKMFPLDRLNDLRVAYGLASGAAAVSPEGISDMMSLSSRVMILDADSGMVANSVFGWETERRGMTDTPPEMPFDLGNFNVSKANSMIRFLENNGCYYRYEDGYVHLI